MNLASGWGGSCLKFNYLLFLIRKLAVLLAKFVDAQETGYFSA